MMISLDRKSLSTPITLPAPSVTIGSDASNKGWGAVLNGQTRTGTGASYQLSGVTGSISSIASVWEYLDRYSSALPSGQCNSSNIHQPESLQTAVPTSNHNLELVHCKEYFTDSRTLAGSPQYNNKPGVKHSPGITAIGCVFQETMAPLEVDLFSSRLTRQLPHIYSWGADPEAMTTDAFMVSTTRICQSTMVFDSPLCLSKVKT